MGLPYIYPDNTLSYTGNFLKMMFQMADPYEVNPVLERALDLVERVRPVTVLIATGPLVGPGGEHRGVVLGDETRLDACRAELDAQGRAARRDRVSSVHRRGSSAWPYTFWYRS